jgi:hypothetical protein
VALFSFDRLEKELNQFRAWMVLKIQFRFPPLFKIIFDAEALGSYERIFTALMKVGCVTVAWFDLIRFSILFAIPAYPSSPLETNCACIVAL